MPNPSTETPPSTRSPAAEKLAHRAEDLAERAHASAVERVQQAREKAEASLQERRSQTADRILRMGDALRSTSTQLARDDDQIARYVSQAGDALERVASYVSDKDLHEIADDAERFARQRPLWFYGGAFLVGLAAGRFLKASANAVEKPLAETEPSLGTTP